jgi:hypothetical protein
MRFKFIWALAAAGGVCAFASIAGAAEPRSVAIQDLTLVAEDTEPSPGAEPDQYHHGWYHHGYHGGYHHGGYHHGWYHHGGYHHGYHHGGYHHGGYHHGYHHGGYHHGGYHHGYHHGGYHHGGYHHGYHHGGYHHYFINEAPGSDVDSLPEPKVDTGK